MTEKRKKRRQFGTVLLRRNPSGKAQTWIGRYTYTRIAVYLSALAGGEAGDFLKHDRQGANATRFLRGPSVMWMGPA